MQNRINNLFGNKAKKILSIYFTAGYPGLNDTGLILKALQESGADLVEIGMPFSDPLADGPTIQESNQAALDNGMNLKLLFSQLENIRVEISIPLLLMGYLNPVLQYGVENFCKKCRETGIDGVILPDLPMQEYLENYQAIFAEYGLKNIFLITPQSSEERIRWIDENSAGFIYMVSSSSTTGAKAGISKVQEKYFARVRDMQLKNPVLVGFGISDHNSFARATEYAAGVIIGSAFIKAITGSKDLEGDIKNFVNMILSDGGLGRVPSMDLLP
jgi:tryptophan synthase alpha chain